MEQITSLQNEKVKYFAKLAKSASFRKEEGLFLVEGEKLVQQALLSGCGCKYLLSSDENLPFSIPDVKVICVTKAVLEKISQMPSPPSLFGVFSLPFVPDVDFFANEKILVLEGLQDPGNVGTVLRTALAFGVDAVLADTNCGDLFGPKALRASMGASLMLPVRVSDNLSADLLALSATHHILVTALSDKAIPLSKAKKVAKTVLILGNEGHGVSEETLSLAHETVIIPMSGAIQSLNVASAASVAMYELFVREEERE